MRSWFLNNLIFAVVITGENWVYWHPDTYGPETYTTLEHKGPNNALQKPAKQSSTYFSLRQYSANAGRAVDGNPNSDLDYKSCSHTDYKDGSNAWWEVDLIHRYTIGDVRLLNRQVNEERLHDVTIDVYDHKTKPRKKKHCITHKGPAGPGWLNLSCNPPVTGRHVRITKPKKFLKDVLTLCEAEIYKGMKAGLFRLKKVQINRTYLHDKKSMELSYLNYCSICG